MESPSSAYQDTKPSQILYYSPCCDARPMRPPISLFPAAIRPPTSPPGLLSLTENKSATFSSSSNPCLDFFFQIVPNTPTATTLSLLAAAWQHDALTALKLVFQLRGVRGTGKSNKEAFLHCASWIHEFHAKTLVANLHLVPKFGYFKDLLEIVLREVEGCEETEKKELERTLRKQKIAAAKARQNRNGNSFFHSRRRSSRRVMPGQGYWSRKGKAARLAKEAGLLEDREKRIAASLERDKAESQKAAELRRLKRKEMATRARRKYVDDRKFAILYDTVAEIFASQLLEDEKALKSKKLSKISLAAKWAPSLDSSYDLRTLMYAAIARRVFKKEDNPEYAALDDERYVSVISDKMRKEFLVPLRRALHIPEVFMSANEWSILPYNRVASVAMRNYADIFIKHDSSRYVQFLAEAAEGKRKVAAGALLPHMIIKDAVAKKGIAQELLAELQWKRMVNDLKENGCQLKSSLAVCDVSGSMFGTPMEVCIALGLLVADLSEEPWKNHVCTFSEDPQIHVVSGESLVDRYNFTRNMNWGMNTDFQKVFSTLLELAKASELPAEKMIKRVFVFSDMEFDEASANPWETDYMVIKKKYSEAGYGDPPEIVFWNLRDSRSTPVLATENGVALVSGFSKNLLKIFLENGSLEQEIGEELGEDSAKTEEKKSNLDPILVMQKAISDEIFDQLQVVD